LMELGVDFDKNNAGDIHLTLEGGHSRHRIFHHKDCTGKEIEDKLIYTVRNRKNITIYENTYVSKIEKIDNNFFLRLLTDDCEQKTIGCKRCILATGGIGRVYKYTTNSAIATGDGICMAYNLGAKIKNLSYVQFHPTAFSAGERERFLISEAVRGEGAHLLNSNGERFMKNYDQRCELAPRDVVSQAIIKESIKTGNENFYLDSSYKDSNLLKNRFPMIYSHLLREGYDLTKDRIPIFPCQHYLMGGIDVDTDSMSTIDGLYAAGECSCTGVHGNNRLASNSLLEALVFSKRAAEDINQKIKDIDFTRSDFSFAIVDCQTEIPKGIRTRTREVMQKCDFVLPNKENAKKCFDEIRKIKEELENNNFKVDSNYIEAKSLVTVAYIILKEVSQ
ncbi:MAG: FAD-binding protein, partial [Oscillospiraceae bacterium]